MIYLKRLMGMFLIVTLSMTMMVSAASAQGEPGIISASVGDRQLFLDAQLNHFHFQKASVEPEAITVQLTCTSSEKVNIYTFYLTDDTVQELFYDGEDLTCTALNVTEGEGGRVNFSATLELEETDASSIFLDEQAGETGEPGDIVCGTNVLSFQDGYNHFHFQKPDGVDAAAVSVNCNANEGGQTYSTSIPLSGGGVYEYFLDGLDVTCSGTVDSGTVNYSATQED